MDGNITIQYLQKYIKEKDICADQKNAFIKLAEEVGELASVLMKGVPRATEDNIKGTLEEEIWDVIYYAIVIANFYDVDIEKWIPIKEAINNKKYAHNITFNPGS